LGWFAIGSSSSKLEPQPIEVAVAGEPRKKRIVHRVVFVVSECGKCVENPVLRRHFAALKIKMN
jgi:bacterioferritin-associated ferredoxin